MRIDVAVAIACIATFWVIALVRPETRNVRFVVILGLLSVAVLWGAPTRGTVALVVELTAGAVLAIVLVWPDRFRIASLTPADKEADATLRRLAAALDGAAPELRAQAFLTTLHAPPFTTPDSPWRPVGRCYRVILARLGDPDGGTSPDRTPLESFRGAGRHYWQLALDRRVLGRRHQPSAWGEDVLLRCYMDEFDRLIPPGSSMEPQFEGQEGWDLEVQERINEIAGLPLRHPLPLANRGLLLEQMEASLAVALGDHSNRAVQRMQTSAEAVPQLWQAPEAEPH